MGVASRWTARLALGLVCAAAASAAAAEELRVLLLESAEPVRVAGVRVAPAGAGLRVDGRPTGPRWSVPGPGPHRAGEHSVRGAVAVERSGRGLRVINQVPLEAYVAGTLGREVYASWSPAMLRAQAVVTRTYALHQRARRGRDAWDLQAGTSDQVYGGVGAESPAVVKAVADTRGEVLVWRGEPILAAFHSSSGGRTAAADEVWGRALPYLTSRPVANEHASPDTYWRVRVSPERLGRAAAAGGLALRQVDAARVVERSASGRVARLELSGRNARGGAARGTLTGRQLRDGLGHQVLRSTLFDVSGAGDGSGDLVFVGSGHGHGVGMSQWGAQAMAERGADYRQILAAFYPGTTLARRSP